MGEKWAVWAGVNRVRRGKHFEDEETHLALLRKAGFIQIEKQKSAGLGSDRLLFARKA